MRLIDPGKTRYRTLWISDVHLGMKACRPSCLADFLERHDADMLYLVGDIIDGLRLRRKWHWSSECDRVVHLILEKARQGTRVIYIPGNHDAFLRKYVGGNICGIQIEADCDHITADGRLLHVRHGDDFDTQVRLAPLIAAIGHGTYHIATFLNTLLFSLRKRMGLPYWSLAKFLKSKSRKATTYVRAYEDAMLQMAKENKAAGIVTGHIHQPALFSRDGYLYCNTGDWVDHCSLLAEYPDGHLEQIVWDEQCMRGHSPIPSSVKYPSLNPEQLVKPPLA